MKRMIGIVIVSVLSHLSIGQGVGIGTSVPNERLEIAGNGRAFFGDGGGAARRGLLIDGIETNAARVDAYDYGLNAGMNLILNTFGGNVGINTGNVHGQLQLSNSVQNRKIVLLEDTNNDHQFFGFGLTNTALRYQVGSSGDDHIFYAGASSSSSTELMRIKGTGNVGIGTGTPLQKLHVAGNTYISQHLGIGTSTPNAPIQLAGTPANRKMVLYDLNNNDHQFYGLGVNPATLRYQVNTTSSNHIFYAGSSDTTSNELMRIRGNGNVDVAGNLEIGYMRVASDFVNVNGLSYGNVQCDCPSGTVVIGGGFNESHNATEILKSYPNTNTSWYVHMYNSGIDVHQLQAWAICARLAN